MKSKQEKGITLIALVVTIVVLLILAGVTINFVLGEGGILDMAKQAAEKTNDAIAEEQGDMANLVGDIQNLLGEGTSVNRAGINVGDYIDYKPDNFENEVVPTYSADELGQTYTGSTSNKAIQQDRDIKWQVLKVYNDGSLDIIGTPTSDKLYFTGAIGYNNGVYILNDICEKLYSRESDGIKARSVSSEDFERAEKRGEDGKTAREKYISELVGKLTADGTFITNVNKEKNTVKYINARSWYPNLYAKENGSGTTNDGKIKEDGISESDKATLDTSIGEIALNQADSLEITNTYYYLEINDDNYGEASKVLKYSGSYWVASRFVQSHSNFAIFGLINLGHENDTGVESIVTGISLYVSTDYALENRVRDGLRPVVHLGSNVQITANELATNPATPHKITKF